MKKYILFLTFLVLQYANLNAQKWFRDMYDPSVNFFTVQSEFNEWWALHKHEILNTEHEENAQIEAEGKWLIYKRWEHQMLPAMLANGGVSCNLASDHFTKQKIVRVLWRNTNRTKSRNQIGNICYSYYSNSSHSFANSLS